LKKSISTKTARFWGDRKCLGDPRKSFVGHPDATQFLGPLPADEFFNSHARSRQLRITFGLRVSDQSSHLHGDQTPIATPEFSAIYRCTGLQINEAIITSTITSTEGENAFVLFGGSGRNKDNLTCDIVL
jgi:hypothetical protein